MVFRQPKWFLPRLPENNHRRLTFAALFVNRHYAGQLFADIVDAGVIAGVGRHQAAEAIAAIAPASAQVPQGKEMFSTLHDA